MKSAFLKRIIFGLLTTVATMATIAEGFTDVWLQDHQGKVGAYLANKDPKTRFVQGYDFPWLYYAGAFSERKNRTLNGLVSISVGGERYWAEFSSLAVLSFEGGVASSAIEVINGFPVGSHTLSISAEWADDWGVNSLPSKSLTFTIAQPQITLQKALDCESDFDAGNIVFSWTSTTEVPDIGDRGINSWFAMTSRADHKILTGLGSNGSAAQSGLCGMNKASVLQARIVRPSFMRVRAARYGGTLEFIRTQDEPRKTTYTGNNGLYFEAFLALKGVENVAWKFTRNSDDLKLNSIHAGFLDDLRLTALTHILLNANGGDVNPTGIWAMPGQSYDYVEGMPSTPDAPMPQQNGSTYTCYEFDGWYYGSTKITARSVVPDVSELTLVAQWKPVQKTGDVRVRAY